MLYPPFPEAYKGATVRLKWLSDGTLSISNLYSSTRREGHATELLQRVCDYADAHAKRAVLLVNEYGTERGLSNQQLIAFYQKFNFVVVTQKNLNVIFMVRLTQELHSL